MNVLTQLTKDAASAATSDATVPATPDATTDATPDATPDAKSEAKGDATVDATPDANSDAKSEAKADAKSDAKPEAKPAAKAPVLVDPSEKRANDLQKFSTEPLKVPGTEILDVEPKATAAAITIVGILVDKLLNPNLVKTIVDNVIKSIELSLAKKKNKLEHLEKDKSFDNSEIIKEIYKQSGGNSFFTEEECSFF